LNSKECFTLILSALDEMQSILSECADSKDPRVNRIRMDITLLENELDLIEIEESGNA
jgi:hypothetical protein